MIVSRRSRRWTNRRCSAEEMKVSRSKKRRSGGIEKIRTSTSVNVEVNEPGSKIITIRVDSIVHIWWRALVDDLYQFVGDLQPTPIGDSIGQNQSRVMDTSHSCVRMEPDKQTVKSAIEVRFGQSTVGVRRSSHRLCPARVSSFGFGLFNGVPFRC